MLKDDLQPEREVLAAWGGLSKGSAGQTGKDSLAGKDDTIKPGGSEINIVSPDGILLRKFKYADAGSSGGYTQGYPDYANYIRGYPTDDTIVGDFNGDGKLEKAWFKDRGQDNFNDCQQKAAAGACRGIIQFSEKSIRKLVIDYCPMWMFKNEGDINCDGKDEIGVLPGWFTSACRDYYVFTYEKGKWITACPPVSSSMNMREAGIVPVEKDTTNKGYAIIRESVDGYVGKNPNHKYPLSTQI